MKITSNNSVEEVNIAYIGGGSRGWAWALMADLALEPNMSGTIKLYDLNYESAQKNEIIGNRLSSREDALGKWEYAAVKNIEDALRGADFVIISILPGGFEYSSVDVEEPERYGVYQPVGDSVGPGGLIRSMRAIPMFEEIGMAIKKYCPNSWVINYTNPMSVCTGTLYRTFPEIKAYGCCHEVYGTQEILMEMLEEMCGIRVESRKDIHIDVCGVNHFTWITSAHYKNIDLFPIYKEFIEKHTDGYVRKKDGNWMNDSFSCANLVKFDLFNRYHVIAAAGDRHLAEFLPPWYLKGDEEMKQWKFSRTPIEWRKNNRIRLLEKAERLAAGEEEVALVPTGEEGVLQMKAMAGVSTLISNVNVPNMGQMPNMKRGTVVETNAIFSGESVQPILARELPPAVHSLVERQGEIQDMVIEAGITRDRELAFQAFLNDPQLAGLRLNEAKDLFDSMIAKTSGLLPDEWKC